MQLRIRLAPDISYEGLLLPRNGFVLVRVRIREAFYLTCLASEEAVEVGADLVAFALAEGVALGATRLGCGLVGYGELV